MICQDSKVMSWWDYGYQITAMANRTILVDNNTWNNTHISRVGQVRYMLIMSTSFKLINPLTPKVYQHSISPYSNPAISNIKLAGRKEMINKVKKVLFVKEILLTSNMGNIWRTVWRIFMLILGFKGLSVLWPCSDLVRAQARAPVWT